MKTTTILYGIVLTGILATGVAFALLKRSSPANEFSRQAIESALQKTAQRDEQGNVTSTQPALAKTYLLADNAQYQIIYQEQDDSYLITVLSATFTQARREAEEALLSLTDTTHETSCDLRVFITTPATVNPELARVIFPLSFCE